MSIVYTAVNKDLYISLITKKLSNELNAAELKDLNSWLSKGKDNANLVKEFKNVWNATSQYKQTIAFDADSAFKSFTTKYDVPTLSAPTSGGKINKYLLAALLLALLVITALFIGNMTNSTVTNSNMHAMTLDLNESSSVVLSPESKLKTFEIGKRTTDLEGSIINLSSLTTLKSGALKENRLAENLSGQAYFNVKNLYSNMPYTIDLKGSGIMAMHDVSFNVQNYIDEKQVVIDIESGTIVFESNEQLFTASKGERLTIDRSSGEVIKSALPKLSPFNWHKGILVFDNTPLDQVFNSCSLPRFQT